MLKWFRGGDQNKEPLSIFEQSSPRPIDADLFASSWPQWAGTADKIIDSMIIWDRIKWLEGLGFQRKYEHFLPRNHWFLMVLMDPPIAMAAPKSARKQRSPVDANEICCPPGRQMQTQQQLNEKDTVPSGKLT